MMRTALPSFCLFSVAIVARSVAADVPVTVRTLGGPDQAGTLVAMEPAHAVVDVAGTARRIPLSEILEVTFDASEPEEASAAPRVFLTSGDRLAADVIRLHEDALICRWPAAGEGADFEIALETVTGIVLLPAAEPRGERSLERELERREFQTDVLFLTNGDRLTGILEELNGVSSRCETAVGSLEVNRSRLRAIGFNAALLSTVEPVESRLLLHLTDGSWLTCQSAEWSGGSDLHVVSVTGARIPVPAGKLRSVRCYGPRVTPLSDLAPAEVVMTPYLASPTPPKADRNAYGGALVVRGETFGKGYGTYARTEATFALGGAWTEFRATAGIDDAANGAGSVVFAVEVDGRRVFESGLVTGRDGSQPVGPIDLKDAESMTLTVEYGTNGDIGDLADWCNPVLIR